MAKTTKLVGYGISFDMKLVGGVKTADDFRRAAKSVEKSVNKASDAAKQHKLQMEALNQAYKKGALDRKQYEQAMNSLKYKEMRREQRIEKERKAVLGLNSAEELLHTRRMQRARMSGMAASAASGLGLGGAAAGSARFLGGLGPGAGLAGAGFVGLLGAKQAVTAFAELEKDLASMEVLFGRGLGNTLQSEFRELAKTTILTNRQLIENAKIWASYGLTTDGMTDRLKRLGTIAGGNSEKFRALTIAFAQVNAQGKLMGQEKNQLINAGMSLQSVADAAGISMDEFADAMKNGEIKAEHLNQALINVTSKGGLFAGYLEKQAETINGKMTILSASWQELLQTLGEAGEGPAGAFLDKLIDATSNAKEFAEYLDKIGLRSPGVSSEGKTTIGLGEIPDTRDPFRKTIDTLYAFLPKAFSQTKSFQGSIRSIEQRSNIRVPRQPSAPMATGSPIENMMFGPFGGFGFGRSSVGEELARGIGQRRRQQALMQATGYAHPAMLSKSQLEEAQRKYAESIGVERSSLSALREFQEKLSSGLSDQIISGFYETTLRLIQEESIKKSFQEKYGMFAPDKMTGGGFNVMEQMAIDQERADEKRRGILFNSLDFERDLTESRIITAEKAHDKEMELLKLKEQEVAERLNIDRKIAAGPAQRDAMFTGGSVEEFMFLRRQTQENETAVAVKEAEDRAAEQRRQIEADRKAADEKRDNAIAELKTAIDDLTIKISNLD